jgi:DNA-binding beta-propeller fold protein YncE
MVEARLVMQPLTAPTPDPEASNPSETPEPELPQPVVSPSVHRIIDTYAGDGREGAQDSYDPLAARFRYPRSLLYDAEGQFIYVSDAWYRLIRKIDLKTGGVTTFGGRAATPTGAPAGVPPALAGAVSGVPSGLALGPDGSLYFCDRENHMVRRITASGLVETVAGNGRMGNADGPLNFAQFAYPADLAVTREGVVYVADAYNNRIRRIENGSVTTIAGEGTSLTAELMGLRLPAPTLNLPVSIVLSADGSALFVGEGKGHRVSRVDVRTGEIIAFAGNGVIGTEGEDGPATSANVALPLALAFDSQGQLLIADGWALTTGVETLLGSSSRVLRVDSEGGIARLAGVNSKSAYGYSGDTEDARQAALNNPSGLAVDASGRIFIADSYNNRIRVLRAVVKPENTAVELEESDTVATDSLASPTAFRAR